jgi:hypothetical protein
MGSSSQMTVRSPRRKSDPVDEIAGAVYEAYKARFGQPSRSFYPSIRRRIKEILAEVRDRDEVELVALTMIDLDDEGFSAGHSLNWGSYDRVRSALHVPDGAWRYALWRYRLHGTDARLLNHVDYWLSAWEDAVLDGAEDDAYEAEQMLKKLWDRSQEIGL